MMMAAHIRIKTTLSTVSLNDINNADFRESQKRSVNCVKRYIGEIPPNRLEHCVGRRMVLQFKEFFVDGYALGCYFEILILASLYEKTKAIIVISILHVAIR
jgi:hypothetical protein